jgi:lysyl-tRNA synthetase class 2
MATLTSLLGSFQPSSGRNHLIAFTLGLLITFLGIRANVRWWFHDLRPGGLHIHHMVIGVVVMVIAGLVTIATNPQGFWGIATALAFGGGVALTLDEFALLLHLENVYWQEQGRISVDAVIVTITAALLFLGGLQPFNAADATPLARLGGWVITILVIVNVTLAIVCFLKGKLWTGVFGCFVPVVATVGAFRLARPGSPWSRRYRDNPGRRERAERRDRREAAMVRAWRRWFFDLIAGKPHIPPVHLASTALIAATHDVPQSAPVTSAPRPKRA